MAVRTAGPPMTITPQVREIVSSLNRDIPIYRVYSMTEAIARPLWFIRVFGTMFMIFGLIALFLAAVGLYAVMAFSVSRRTREVGIRMALGAKPGDVLGMVVRQGVWQLGMGMMAGLTVALGISQLLKILLFDVQPRDPGKRRIFSNCEMPSAVDRGIVGVHSPGPESDESRSTAGLEERLSSSRAISCRLSR